MDVIFIDQKGNKKNFLYQYDKGQYLVIKDWEYDVAPKVEYQMGTLKTAISVTPVLEGTTVRCRIPDTLIAIGDDIVVYLYVEDAARGEVVMTFFISVRPRKRPSDYTFPSSYTPSAHASTHATDGSDPISPADIGAVSQTDFATLVETVNNLATLTDATTGAQYTLGVNAGKLLLVPYGEAVEPIANGDQTAY